MNSSKMDSYFKIEKNNEDIILTPTQGYDTVLIFMHGLGDSALGVKDVFDSPNKPIPNRMKVVLLTANQAAVTVNGGMVMNSWFDIKSLKWERDSVEQSDVLKSGSRIEKIIDNEAKLLNKDYSKIFLGGFSQGGSMSMYVGLTFPEKIGGIICLSGFLFAFTEIDNGKKKLPIFAAHGINDELMPEKLAKASFDPIKDKGFNFTYKTYNVGHFFFHYDELQDIKNFITNLI